MELRREHAALAEERDGINQLLASDKQQWKLVGAGLRHVRDVVGAGTALGRRRTTFGEAPEVDAAAAVEALIVKEPITIILSERGWIRAAKGKVDDPSELKFKEGDKLAFVIPAETTDKLIIFASDGRFFTLGCDKLPSARGHGEPVRLMIDLDDNTDIVDVFAYQAGRKRVVASSAGYGFVLPEEETFRPARPANRCSMSPVPQALPSRVADGDFIATVGDNGKMLVFPLSELPEMPRGKGVKLQNYREGGLRDLLVFSSADGVTTVDPLRPHAGVGRLARLGGQARRRRQGRPQGLPRRQTVQAKRRLTTRRKRRACRRDRPAPRQTSRPDRRLRYGRRPSDSHSDGSRARPSLHRPQSPRWGGSAGPDSRIRRNTPRRRPYPRPVRRQPLGRPVDAVLAEFLALHGQMDAREQGDPRQHPRRHGPPTDEPQNHGDSQKQDAGDWMYDHFDLARHKANRHKGGADQAATRGNRISARWRSSR